METITTPRFASGRLMMTRGIAVLIGSEADAGAIVQTCLQRHLSGDWGEMDPEDLQANDDALRDDTRLFSSYLTALGKVWVITEADRSATTILLPEEY